MGIANFLRNDCPLLWGRMHQDAEQGKFSEDWSVSGRETREYLSSLLGREIAEHEGVRETCQAVEERLSHGNAH